MREILAKLATAQAKIQSAADTDSAADSLKYRAAEQRKAGLKLLDEVAELLANLPDDGDKPAIERAAAIGFYAGHDDDC